MSVQPNISQFILHLVHIIQLCVFFIFFYLAILA
jgi:hypothetical protein